MAPLILNGERAVVLLFVSSILYSTHVSIIFEAISFSLLAVFALFVEISVESCGSTSRFKTRPGASSGIFLGAVTLPGLAVSRLIHLSRALLVNEVGAKDVEFIRLQYWATSTSCLCVLVFLCFIFRHDLDKTKLVYFKSGWNTKFSISSMALFAALCCLSFSTKSSSGSYLALTLFWIVCHGFAAVKFIQHVLHTFPGCASFGEALLVTAGFVVYFGDMFAFTIAKHWLSLLLAVTVSGLLEAYTAQLDNAFIPLVFYSLLCL